MDNFNTTDMENYAKKMDEKFADKAADKADYQEFKADFKDLVEKTFEDKGIHDVEVENRLVDKVNETYDAFTIKHTGSDVGVNISVTEAYKAYATSVTGVPSAISACSALATSPASTSEKLSTKSFFTDSKSSPALRRSI